MRCLEGDLRCHRLPALCPSPCTDVLVTCRAERQVRTEQMRVVKFLRHNITVTIWTKSTSQASPRLIPPDREPNLRSISRVRTSPFRDLPPAEF